MDNVGVPGFRAIYNSAPPRSGIRWANNGWERTPWWDWHRYLHGDMRCWRWEDGPLNIGGPYDGDWHYRTFIEHARKVLEETCDRV